MTMNGIDTDKAEKECLLKEHKNSMIIIMNFQRKKELNLKIISLVRLLEKHLYA